MAQMTRFVAAGKAPIETTTSSHDLRPPIVPRDGSSSIGPMEPKIRFPPTPPHSTFLPQPPPPLNPYSSTQFPSIESRPPRMELPVFTGANPEGWSYRAEQAN
ncbi:hypothetical protein G4B88_013908 [Cannabis sativa]|uniref:Uncharacterized protein n=1 Tax=Cannabis sativa TaxID=3483 RepID=A0A7J6I0J2_CANSA|nr:hypothetical protein G4B88_013908 [Cannabis sativa]